jgi:hypothetical protein
MVKCADCGFLSVRNKETRVLEEGEFETRQSGDIRTFHYDYLPTCFVIAFNLAKEIGELKQLPKYEEKRDGMGGVIWPQYSDINREAIQRERDCRSFIQWQQGFTPKEHREMMDREWMLKREEERRRNDRKWHWIEVGILIIGAGLFTLLGSYISRVGPSLPIK